ncbi:hypothetical protein D3C84_822690 [compost metagenome]
MARPMREASSPPRVLSTPSWSGPRRLVIQPWLLLASTRFSPSTKARASLPGSLAILSSSAQSSLQMSFSFRASSRFTRLTRSWRRLLASRRVAIGPENASIWSSPNSPSLPNLLWKNWFSM